MDNNGQTHGYLWRDGIVRTEPEQGTPYTAADQRNAVRIRAEYDEDRQTVPHVTQETLDRAYAAWLRDYTAWKKRMDEWEAKYGQKV